MTEPPDRVTREATGPMEVLLYALRESGVSDVARVAGNIMFYVIHSGYQIVSQEEAEAAAPLAAQNAALRDALRALVTQMDADDEKFSVWCATEWGKIVDHLSKRVTEVMDKMPGRSRGYPYEKVRALLANPSTAAPDVVTTLTVKRIAKALADNGIAKGPDYYGNLDLDLDLAAALLAALSSPKEGEK